MESNQATGRILGEAQAPSAAARGCSDTNTVGACAQAECADRQQPRGFDWAIRSIKDGRAVRRMGWNGRGMCVFLNKGAAHFPDDRPIPAHIDGIRRGLFESWSPGITTRLPNINMRSTSGSTVTGWLASQTDMLADDWELA